MTRGDIVGTFTSGGAVHGFLFSAGAFTTVDVPGASSTAAVASTLSGDIVGEYTSAA